MSDFCGELVPIARDKRTPYPRARFITTEALGAIAVWFVFARPSDCDRGCCNSVGYHVEEHR